MVDNIIFGCLFLCSMCLDGLEYILMMRDLQGNTKCVHIVPKSWKKKLMRGVGRFILLLTL